MVVTDECYSQSFHRSIHPIISTPGRRPVERKMGREQDGRHENRVMNLIGKVVGKRASLRSSNVSTQDEYVCWSRMQAEAGQGLEAIIHRKEVERQAGDGCFLWGVGNPPAQITRMLARTGVPVPVVFSVMKTKPKAVDLAPSRTVVWRKYVDAQGIERELPAHSLVTSRGDSATGAKKAHYALMCHSAQPLTIRRGELFDPSAFRNAGGTGAPVGASQVTALLRRVDRDGEHSGYEANLTAWLTGSYWVRLSDPRELNNESIEIIARAAENGVCGWRAALDAVRKESGSTERHLDWLLL